MPKCGGCHRVCVMGNYCCSRCNCCNCLFGKDKLFVAPVATGAVGQQGSVPVGFDAEGFLRVGKPANDAGDWAIAGITPLQA